MKVLTAIIDGLKFIIEGVTRIFRPTDDHYPATGVVPFTGEPYHSAY